MALLWQAPPSQPHPAQQPAEKGAGAGGSATPGHGGAARSHPSGRSSCRNKCERLSVSAGCGRGSPCGSSGGLHGGRFQPPVPILLSLPALICSGFPAFVVYRPLQEASAPAHHSKRKEPSEGFAGPSTLPPALKGTQKDGHYRAVRWRVEMTLCRPRGSQQSAVVYS